ncbi:uncharacterized protein LOC130975243 [Arachis stenosperma]|uniref:uncharacterized protein LOC130975243 n=1 Tax=Arachis stenosperma TaxID=217475 RepID=UPI0025AB6267|nr:uncharacterized protein LOC130975243 [Arachis stenosperma]
MLAIEGTIQPKKDKDSDVTISFNQADFRSASPNLDDPVVISIQVGELLVRKTLLDPDCYSPYNIIIGRPALNIFRAVVSTLHLCVKFSVQENKIATVYADHQEAQQCYNASLKLTQTKQKARTQVQAIHTSADTATLADLDPKEDLGERPRPMDNLQQITLTADNKQCTYIGEALEGEDRARLIHILRQNTDLFAWTPNDMPGINPEVICHKLAIDKTARPIAQKKRNLGEEKRQAALEETKKLLNAGFIKEIRFTTWLSNVVMVRKNSGATYQRLMDKVFQQQIGQNMEVYVDNMVAKTPAQGSHCDDLVEIFKQFRAYNMRLNPDKYAFGVQGGKFLGFMLTSRGIEANPEKCKAVLNMTSPKTVKEVQQLAGRIAALSRFLPTVANRSYHFFQTFSKGKKFTWTDECENSFTELKQNLTSPPILQRPETGKPLCLYLSVSNHAISSVLVTETGRKQNPVYFISRVLQPTETRYPKIEQLALALVTMARRLRHYFQSHTIIVRTDQPLRQILTRPELAGRLIKWAIELSEFDIQYEPRKTLKSQVLADFISEMTNDTQYTEVSWSMHVDGASNKEGSGAGILLMEGNKVVAEQSLRFRFNASNNQAEYEALLTGLKLSLQLQISRITVYCDSSLVVHQIKGEFQVKDPLLEKYWLITKDLISKFSKFDIIHVNREQNTRADVLSKLATTRQAKNTSALSQLTFDKPSFEHDTILSIIQVPDWRTPLLDYINKGTMPKDEPNLPLFRRRASFYTVLGNTLYRRGHSRPLLKCISWEEAEDVMVKTHEGVCGNHIGGRALAAKILRTGYYWPTIKRDCISKVKACDNCQKHATLSETPAKELHTIEGLKKKLGDTKGEWADLIPEILWSYNTSIQSATGETPFKLVYGAKALIPVEVSVPTLRTELYDQSNNLQARTAELDLVEEERDISAIKQRARKQYLEQRHNRKVVHRSFNNGDLVLRRTEEAQKPPTHGKLAANWEEPF